MTGLTVAEMLKARREARERGDEATVRDLHWKIQAAEDADPEVKADAEAELRFERRS